MAFFFLWLGCNVLVLQCVALIMNTFNYKMPWYARAFRLILGSALGCFAYVVAVLSLATLIQGGN